MKRLKPQLMALSHQEGSYRTEVEFRELWKNLLQGTAGLCPTGSVERPLFYLEEFYDWSNLSSEKDMFITNGTELLYLFLVEKNCWIIHFEKLCVCRWWNLISEHLSIIF